MEKEALRNIISNEDLSSFLEDGAVLSWSANKVLLAWGRLADFADHPTEDAINFYIPDFFLSNENSWLSYRDHLWISPEALSEALAEWLALEKGVDQSTQRLWSDPESEMFRSQFVSVHDKILAGEISKAVPVVFAESQGGLSVIERAKSLQRALRFCDSLKVYGYWNQQEGLLGATPEVLFSRQGSEIKTMALAGTAPLGENLLDDEKERFEHQLVVEDIRSGLQDLADVRVGATYEWDLSVLKHLRTDIRLYVEQEIGVKELCLRLHPTSALGVFPREKGWQWLSDIGPNERGRFGAPFAVQVNGYNQLAVVAIRNVMWSEEHTLLGSGCGVVGQSQLDKEWDELSLKRSQVRKVLDL